MEIIFLMFLDHTQRRTTVGRILLDERSARRRDLYLTTHDTHNRQISMPPVGFEPTISAGERPGNTLSIQHAIFPGVIHVFTHRSCLKNYSLSLISVFRIDCYLNSSIQSHYTSCTMKITVYLQGN